MGNLYSAANQYAQRPDDERSGSLAEMYAKARGYADTAVEAQIGFDKLRVEADTETQNLMVVGTKGIPATITNFAFGQIAKQVGAPVQYLRAQPPTLAAQNLNWSLKERGRERNSAASLMFHKNGEMVLRSCMTERYNRIWNYELIERGMALEAQGWQVPPGRATHRGAKGARQATADDVLRGPSFELSVKEGDWIMDSGLYSSDHDCYGFQVFNDNRIEDGSAGGLGRGIIWRNSEVGDGSFWVTWFLYRMVCGNHIIWDAQDVREIRVAHTGNVRGKIANFEMIASEYAEHGANDIEARIKKSQTKQIAATKQEVLDILYKLPFGAALGQKRLKEAYELTEQRPMLGDGSPRTAWGMVQGLTRMSQAQPFGEVRHALDRAAGKLLQIDF